MLEDQGKEAAGAVGCLGRYEPIWPSPGSGILVAEPHLTSSTSEAWIPGIGAWGHRSCWL